MGMPSSAAAVQEAKIEEVVKVEAVDLIELAKELIVEITIKLELLEETITSL